MSARDEIAKVLTEHDCHCFGYLNPYDKEND